MYSGPGNEYPQGGYPQGGYPQGGFPQGGYPQGGFPQGGYPQGGYAPGYPPQPGYPPTGYAPPPGPGPVGFVHPPPDPDGMNYGTGPQSTDGQFGFNEKTVRRAFIRKVYSILMCMLLVCLGFVCLMTLHHPTKLWVRRNPILVFISWALAIVLMLMLACCEKARRSSPMNYIVLGLFTVVMSFMTAATAARYSSYEVLAAVGITAVLCFALTIFAFQTKWDFTVIGGGLFIATLILMILGIVLIFFPSKIATIAFASIGAFLFSLYLIYDTQMIMGGKHKYSISPEEYIFAAVTLFTDIVTIFLDILTIIGASRN